MNDYICPWCDPEAWGADLETLRCDYCDDCADSPCPECVCDDCTAAREGRPVSYGE